MRTRHTLTIVLATLATSSVHASCFPDRSVENPYAGDSGDRRPAGRGADSGAADGGAGDSGEPSAGMGGAGEAGEPSAGMGGAGEAGEPSAGMGGAGQGAGMAGAAGTGDGGKLAAGMGGAASGGNSAAGMGGAGSSAAGTGGAGSSVAGMGGAGASGSSGAGVGGAGSGGVSGGGGQAPRCHRFVDLANIQLSEIPPSGAWQASSETRDDHGVVPHFLCVGSRGLGKAVFGYGAGCYMPADATTLKEVSALQILTTASPACLNWRAHSSGQPLPNDAFRRDGTSVCRALAENIQTESPGVRSTGTHVGQVRANAERFVCIYELYGQLRSAENYELLIELK